MAPQDPPEVDRWTGKQGRKRSVEKNNGERREENAGEKLDHNIRSHSHRGFHLLLFT